MPLPMHALIPAPLGDPRTPLLRELKLGDELAAGFTTLARLAAAEMGCEHGAVLLATEAGGWRVLAAHGGPLPMPPRGHSPCDRALDDARSVEVSDAAADAALHAHPWVRGEPHARRWLAAPLRVEGHTLGVLCALAREPGPSDAPSVDRLDELAALAAELLASRLRDQRSRVREARLRASSRAGREWLWETDAAGRITWLSDDLTRRPGPHPAHRIGEPWTAPYAAGAGRRPAEWAAATHTLRAGGSLSELLLDHPVGGEWRTVASNAAAVFDSAGRFMGLRGASRDVTAEARERDAAVQALDAERRALAESRETLTWALNAIPDLWFVFDEHGIYLDSNAPDHPFLLRPFAELRGRSVREVLPAPLAAAHEQLIRQAIETGTTQRLDYELTIADGERLFEARISPMPARRVLFLARELTELRALEREALVMERVLDAEAAMPVVVVDALAADQPIIYANRAFERLTGYTRAEVLGRNCRFLQGDEPDQPALAPLREAIAAGRPCQVRLRNARKDGGRFINELHVAPVHDASGRLTHLVGVLDDVTTEAAAADKLAFSEAMYRAVASTISDGLLIVLADASVAAANPAACEILGVAAEQLVGAIAPWPFTIADAEGQPLAGPTHPVRQVLDGGAPVSRRLLRLHRGDGESRWLELSCNLLRVLPSDAPRPALVVIRDVTAQREAELSLAVAEERWKFALEGGSQGVWDWNARDPQLYVSPTWMSSFGFKPGEVHPDARFWMQRAHPEDLPAARAALAEHLKGRTPLFHAEMRVQHRDGHYVVMQNRGKVVKRDADGRAVRVVGTLSDVTAQREAEAALRDKQAAELASKAKSEFLSRMSHEMRTPLNAVIGFSQLLASRPGAPDAAQVQDFAGHVLRAGEHLLALINDVLDLQRVEEGRLTLHAADVALDGLVERVIALLAPAAQAAGVTQENLVPPGTLVRGDERHLRQVLLNIGSNAIKYNRAGGRVRWALDPRPHGRRLALTVEDTGSGLDAAQLDRLFQPFERLGRETSTIEGTGLGLIIARRLTDAMGGALSVSSRPGVGTRVTIELPPAPRAMTADAAKGEVASRTAPAAAPAPEPLRMLYVEDNRVNAILFQEAIRLRAGIELRLAEDGESALELVREWRPDVLVLDAHLPGMDGFELLAALRREPGLAQTTAFMCSADAMPDDVARATRAGFAGYWSKPIDIARILRDLDALVPPGRAGNGDGTRR